MMFGLIVILREPFADLTGSDPDNRVGAQIIFGGPSKRLDTNRPLFQIVRVSRDRLEDYIIEENRISPAMRKLRAGSKPHQLLFDELWSDSWLGLDRIPHHYNRRLCPRAGARLCDRSKSC